MSLDNELIKNFDDMSKEELITLLREIKSELEENEVDDDAESDAIYDIKQWLEEYK